MNQPPENPYASPSVDETLEGDPVLDAEVMWNEEFAMRVGNIVGNSPLSLPDVCLYCAADIVDDLGIRQSDKFYRLRLLEAEKPVSMSVSYSVCSKCIEAAQSWRRRRGKSLYFILATVVGGAISFAGMVTLSDGEHSPNSIFTGLFGLFATAGVGGFFCVAYCESQLPKGLALKKFAGDTMTLTGAGWKFIQRFR
ncbi:hypothetical protein M4951_01395 [Blastopirellula sp. J2-11]|uniref:hypothetical protein n=1 Tax=Blastopirellula sp. J2-11 TaxID=2943192 RepID=UPI0021C92EFE|nr:hypothetical protein [Blastopirellula sp. J2-11]UUO06980.1 hypothetical protein M4951_01395 [Blastopirellula sp. J2-11]